MAAFPSYPLLLASGYDETPQPVIDRTKMESGPPKQFLVSSRQMVNYTVNYLLVSLADYQSFLVWYRTAIAYGNDWFTWTNPTSGIVVNARMVKGTIEFTPLNVKELSKWKASFTIETWE